MAMRAYNAVMHPSQLKKAFTDWIARSHKKQLNVFITGKTGVGKSRLVNALVGKDVAGEGRRKEACTDTVTPYPAVVIEGIEVVIWDSPGLQDETCDEKMYLENLKRIWQRKDGIDVVIYCVKMSDTRIYSEDKKAIRTLTEGFGTELWKKTVIALTFANTVKDPDEKDEFYFERQLDLWQEKIHKILTGLQIECNDVAIVPAGNYRKLGLPTSANWIADLWTECYKAMSISASVAWYLINKHRLQFTGCKELAAAIVSSQPEDAVRELSESNTPQRAGESQENQDIPSTIPLASDQEACFWTKLWDGFCNAVKRFFNCAVSKIIELFT